MYEEIKVQPKLQLKRLAEFLECPFSTEEENCGVMDEILRMCSFENLSNLEVNTNGKLSTGEENKVFFRKGEVGDWKNYFTIEMNEKLNHIIEQKFQGSGINDECKKLLLTLPKERGWLASHIYNYQGFWATPRIIQGVIACQQQFQAQDSDIILVTTPKSGTTWLKALLFGLVNRVKHPIFEQNHPLLIKNRHDIVPYLKLTLYVDGQVPNSSSITTPRLLSTHLPFASLPKSIQDSNTKLVYLCRNSRDTFISMWHFTNNLKLDHKDIIPLEKCLIFFNLQWCEPLWSILESRVKLLESKY
ncbi:hypothetical protein H5410_064136 [Solanum commersonii]|uniref:Sulfotransferase n=1 Tax=Solanum commersonii TaxID=4109 RepID=A0A9J5W0A2_SOLCO|nr:hypothetical protein H5410_064136 [Solanum commersonii]